LSKARQAAVAVVHAVCEQQQSLDLALEQHRDSIKDQETALYQEIAYGGVRWYLAYQAYLDTQLIKPFKAKDRIINTILVTALYQLDYTQQAPHAVVNEAVNLANAFRRKWASGVINAILRTYLRLQAKLPLPKQPNWLVQSFPAWLYEQIRLDWPEHIDEIIQASQAKPPLSIRVNIRQHTPAEYLQILVDAGIEANLCMDSQSGITLTKPISVNKLPGFEVGWVSIQDEAAQLAATLLDLAPKQRVLDACAAPGGKSMHILEAEPALTELTVLDFPERMARLRENFNRAGLQATIVEGNLLSADEWWTGKPFDRILLDAPCSGTGIIRRHPDIKFRRQAENIKQFSTQQLNLLRNALQMLKPGGKLLYTTCSILAAENEQCISQFVEQTHGVHSLALPENIGIYSPHGRQRLPGVHPGDGFFYALLQKTDES
jgi:16S rRNA (cytosine967-C5)-methyltransferase